MKAPHRSGQMPNTASPREEQSSKCWRPPASRALSRLDDTQRPARTHESLQFRGNEHELTACSGEIRRCPRSRYQSAPGAKSSYRNRRVRGPFWCNPITLLDPRQPALTVDVRGPPGPAARVSQRGSITARSRRRPRPEAEAGRRLWLRAKITRQRPSERVELEFEGMGSGWFTIRFVVALPMVGAAAIA